MKIIRLTILTLVTATLISCSYLIPGKRKLIREVQRQLIPDIILNSNWTLSSFGGNVPDCDLILIFLEKGQLKFKFKGVAYQGDYMWYLVKDSVIHFHTRPLEKIAWTQDNCEMNPYSFALYIQGDKKVIILNDQLTLTWLDEELIFKRIVS